MFGHMVAVLICNTCTCSCYTRFQHINVMNMRMECESCYFHEHCP